MVELNVLMVELNVLMVKLNVMIDELNVCIDDWAKCTDGWAKCIDGWRLKKLEALFYSLMQSDQNNFYGNASPQNMTFISS